MALPWFRMFWEFSIDPKVQMLSESDQRRFVMLLCHRCSNETETLHDVSVAFRMRISVEEWLKTKAVLTDAGLIDERNHPVAWEKRQRSSDSSTHRVRKHREAKRKQKGEISKANQPDETECNVSGALQKRNETVQEEEENRVEENNSIELSHACDETPVATPRRPLPKTRNTPPAPTPEFQAFWDAYPQRLGGNSKSESARAYAKALLRGATHEKLIAGARALKSHHESIGNIGTQFVPMATTWLNQDRWETQVSPTLSSTFLGEDGHLYRPSPSGGRIRVRETA